ncbi:DNA-directed RNA polymerase III subunit RPC6 isoform X3 [Parasteatoda tepidariorum]|uniref:DNA-directed RNA polymerase III subunit RPC6 isoform X3 n=1 Tax=Parasteatoda tepidariorum TaxID=114398 RepID=UPI0039BC8815
MDLEKNIIDLLLKNPDGVTNKMLQTELSSIGVAQLVEVLNNLTAADKIQIFHKGKQLVYKMKESVAKSCRSADIEEKVIYQLTERAGNKGIWIRDLRLASNLPQTQVNKIVKSLESKKLIKSVTSVTASKKKVYMLYNIEPDRSVTGGTWYSDQEFESEFVEVLNQQCYRYLSQAAMTDKSLDPISQRKSSFKTSEEICDHINSLKVSKVVLSMQDIETILDTLIYDGKVEKCLSPSSSDRYVYRDVKPLVTSCGLMRVPCGVCPVSEDCQEGTIISPSTCPYMKEWLDF